MLSSYGDFYIFLFSLEAFISFTFLILLTRTSNTMLNKSGEDGPDLCGSVGWNIVPGTERSWV